MTEGPQDPAPDQGAQNTEFEPITSQQMLDKIIGSRLHEERAKFADYKEVKAKAAKLDELEQERKSEQDKLTERAEKAERRAAEAESSALRSEVAAEKGVPASSLTGASKDDLESSADALLAWRDAAGNGSKKTPAPGGYKSGASKTTDAMSDKERAAAALRTMRSGS